MFNKIEMEINNGRTMQITQQKYDSDITLMTYNTRSGIMDSTSLIKPCDMVMILNWYRYQKENGNKNLEF